MSNEQWSEWIEWSGGECPVSKNSAVQWKGRGVHKNGTAPISAGFLNWQHIDSDMDIIAYRYRLDSAATPEEDEAWEAMEERQAAKHSKYHREIKPGVWVDVYDVLHAWRVQSPALQHLIKKALAPGQRGHKTLEQDMNDIVASALRARELSK